MAEEMITVLPIVGWEIAVHPIGVGLLDISIFRESRHPARRKIRSIKQRNLINTEFTPSNATNLRRF